MNMNTSAVSTFQGKTISFDYRRTDNVIPLEVVKTGESYILGFVGDAIRVYHYLGDKKHIRTAAKELQASLEQEVGLVAEC